MKKGQKKRVWTPEQKQEIEIARLKKALGGRNWCKQGVRYWTSMFITSITGALWPLWAIKAQFSTRPNWASKFLGFLMSAFT